MVAVLNRASAFAAAAALLWTAVACAPPPTPPTHVVQVEADRPSWQSQPMDGGPREAVRVKEGDAIVLSIAGRIVYQSELGGLRKRESDGWAQSAEAVCERCPLETAAVGTLLWRIGSDGPVRTVAWERPAFSADRDGDLQFLVNDRREAYGDNTGSYRVSITVVPR